MKRYVILLIIILTVLSFVGVSQAQPLSMVMSRWSIGVGRVVNGGEYKLSSVASQPIIGNQSGEDYRLTWGFWNPLAQDGIVYLPIVVRSSQEITTSTNFVEVDSENH